MAKGRRIQRGSRIKHLQQQFSTPQPDQTPQEVATPQEVKKTSNIERLLSIDIFRGFTILLMIFVDDAGSCYNHIFDHSPWDGITLADFVMPFFLFIVGASIVRAFNKKFLHKHWSDAIIIIITRSLKLFLIGLICQGGRFPTSYNLAVIRIGGILQRIALAYLVTGLVYLISFYNSHKFQFIIPDDDNDPTPFMKFKSRVISALKLLILHYPLWIAAFILFFIYSCFAYMVFVPIEGCGYANFTPECNSIGYVERSFMIDHMYKHPTYRRLPECKSLSPPHWCDYYFDPEGVVASFQAAICTIIGCYFSIILDSTTVTPIASTNITSDSSLILTSPNSNSSPSTLAEDSLTEKQPLEREYENKKNNALSIRIFSWSILMLILYPFGFFLHYYGAIPWNKNLFSFSYLAFMCATSIGVLMMLYFIVDFHTLEDDKKTDDHVYTSLDALTHQSTPLLSSQDNLSTAVSIETEDEKIMQPNSYNEMNEEDVQSDSQNTWNSKCSWIRRCDFSWIYNLWSSFKEWLSYSPVTSLYKYLLKNTSFISSPCTYCVYFHKPLIVIFCVFVMVGMNAILMFLLGACDWLAKPFKWVYYEDKDRNLVHWLQVKVLFSAFGANTGQFIFTWITIIVLSCLSTYLYHIRWFWSV